MVALRQLLDGELGSHFDGISWEVAPGAADLAATLPSVTAEVVYYAAREAVRNAARHGRNGNQQRPLHLTIAIAAENGLAITIADDGVGAEASRPSADASDHGLMLHSTMMAVVGGSLIVESLPDRGTRVVLLAYAGDVP